MDVGERLETTGPGRHRGERKKEVTFASAAEKKEADNSKELSALVEKHLNPSTKFIKDFNFIIYAYKSCDKISKVNILTPTK